MKFYELLQIEYANIQSISDLQSIKKDYQSEIQAIIKEIHDFSTKKSQQAIQHEIIQNKMMLTLNKNKDKILELKSSIEKITIQQQIRLKQFEQQKQKSKKNLQNAHYLQTNQKINRIEQLEQQYRNYKELEEKQLIAKEKINEIQNNLLMKQYNHHDMLSIQQQKQKKLNETLIQGNNILLVQTKKNAARVALDQVSQERLQNQQQNQLLKTKLAYLQEELSKLKKQRDQILYRKKQIKMNSCLNEDQLEEYKAVGSLQKVKIKNQQEKLQNLKKLMDIEIIKRQTRINEQKKEKESLIKMIKLKIHNSEKQLDDLRINGEKLTMLGQTILMQRKQVQDFFIMSMEQSKKQVQSEQQKQSQQKQYGEKVDIEQLLPQDKLRIITNLYTKLALARK